MRAAARSQLDLAGQVALASVQMAFESQLDWLQIKLAF